MDEWPYPDDADFIVLRDPDGNEFCVIDHCGQYVFPTLQHAIDGIVRPG